MKLSNVASVIISFFLIVYILIIGKALILPFVLALILWYVLASISQKSQNIKIGTWKVPYFLSIIIAIFIIGVAIYAFFTIISSNIHQVIAQAPVYQIKIEEIISKTQLVFGIENAPTLKQIIKDLNLSKIFSAVADMASSLAGYEGMIIIYLIFIFIESRVFDKKLNYLIKNKKDKNNIKIILNQISNDIKSYITIKTLVSLLTAVLSYILLISVGVDFAGFWAMLIFLLNYIPTVGSIVAIIFPILLTLIQFTGLIPFFIVFIGLATIQFVIGNILEPKLMGRSLNLSPLVIIISLALWGQIWGIIGMFLCIPIMVVINIILSKFPQTRSIAIMLSSTGKIKK